MILLSHLQELWEEQLCCQYCVVMHYVNVHLLNDIEQFQICVAKSKNRRDYILKCTGGCITLFYIKKEYMQSWVLTKKPVSTLRDVGSKTICF